RRGRLRGDPRLRRPQADGRRRRRGRAHPPSRTTRRADAGPRRARSAPRPRRGPGPRGRGAETPGDEAANGLAAAGLTSQVRLEPTSRGELTYRSSFDTILVRHGYCDAVQQVPAGPATRDPRAPQASTWDETHRDGEGPRDLPRPPATDAGVPRGGPRDE